MLELLVVLLSILSANAFLTPMLSTKDTSSIALRLSSRPADDYLLQPTFPSSVVDVKYEVDDQEPLPNHMVVKNDDTTTMIMTETDAIIEKGEEEQFTPFQKGVRLATALTTIGYLVNPDPLDNAISNIYSIISNWDAASAPLFEAKIAVLGFMIPIICFSSLHFFLGEKKTKASRFDGQLPVRPFEWLEDPARAFNPVAAYLGSIWIYHQFIHPHGALPELAPTFGVFAVELVFGVCLYDLLFFPLHYLMHKSSWGKMRQIHGYHHRVSSHSLNALETVQHSYLDGFLQVAVNVLVQQISPFGGFGHKHFLSRLAHNLVVTYLLTEAHSGYDLPWMSHRIFPEVLGGSTRHEQHHHNGRVYYQQYFKYLDDFFGFTSEDVIKNKQLESKETTASALPSQGEK